MKIGNLNVFINNNSQLVIKKNNLAKYSDIIFFLLLPFLFIGLFFYLISNAENLRSLGFFPWILICVFLLAIIAVSYYNIKRSIRKNKSYFVSLINKQVFINDVLFCYYHDLSPITISKLTDGDGASSYNVLLCSNNKTFPLALDLTREEALSLASILSEYLVKEILIKDGKMIIP